MSLPPLPLLPLPPLPLLPPSLGGGDEVLGGVDGDGLLGGGLLFGLGQLPSDAGVDPSGHVFVVGGVCACGHKSVAAITEPSGHV